MARPFLPEAGSVPRDCAALFSSLVMVSRRAFFSCTAESGGLPQACRERLSRDRLLVFGLPDDLTKIGSEVANGHQVIGRIVNDELDASSNAMPIVTQQGRDKS